MMKQKALALLGFFAVLVMAVSMVSAVSVAPTTLSLNVYNGSSNSVSFIMTNNDSVNYTSLVSSVEPASNGLTIGLTLNNTVVNENNTVLVTVNVAASSSASEGQYATKTITVFNGSNPLVSVPLTVTVIKNISTPSTNDSAIINSLCRGYTQSTSQIVLSSEDNNKIDNADEWEWKPLDNTEIEFDLKNNADDDDDHDYDVELFLYDSSGDVTGDVVTDQDNLLEESFSVDQDRKETLTFAFQIDGQTEQYSSLAVWAVVKEIDNDVCYAKKIDTAKIVKNSKQVIVKTVDATTSVKAGETVSIEVEVANIGKQDEDQVKVILYNKDLGLNLYKEITDVNEGDTATATFLVTIPATAKQGTYKLLFSTEFDYDSDDEEYGEESDTDDDYTKSITVFGMTSAPTIGAKLVSDAKVGKTLQVDVSLTNNGDADETYDLIVEGASWANNAKFADDSVLVKAGETEVVRLTLVPQEDGEKDFTIKAVYGDEIKKQTVSVNIASNTGLTNIFAGISTLGYLIGAIVVLAILILMVAIVKLAKPRRRVESIAY